MKPSDHSERTAEGDVQAVLCWSEYYNGKWQPTKTSDINSHSLERISRPLALEFSTAQSCGLGP